MSRWKRFSVVLQAGRNLFVEHVDSENVEKAEAAALRKFKKHSAAWPKLTREKVSVRFVFNGHCRDARGASAREETKP